MKLSMQKIAQVLKLKEQSVEEILNDVKEKSRKIAAFTAALNKTFGQGDAK